MKSNIPAVAIGLLLCCGAKAQNYNAGPVHVNGSVYDASASSGSMLTTNSDLLVGTGGTWLLNTSRFTTPRTSASQTEVVKFAGGTYSRSTGYIDGYTAADDQAAGFVLPVGHGGYAPLTINSALATGNPLIAAWYDNQPMMSTHIAGELYYFLPGYYDLQTTGAGVSVTPTVPAASIPGTSLIGTVDGITFVNLGPANSAAVLPLGGYQLRFANSSSVLPLTLKAFTAEKQSGIGLLSWKIIAEHGVQSYTVERSADGRRFGAIGSLPSLGTTAQERSYLLSDAAPLKGANYYRLRIAEQSGKASYSAIRLLNFDANVRIAVYPNPVLNKALITGLEKGMQVAIISMHGQQLLNYKTVGNTMEVAMEHLPAAAYQVQVKDVAGKLVGNYRIVKE